jgi:hypothetical protein
MLKTCLNYSLALLMLLGVVAPFATAQTKTGQKRLTTEEAKIKVAKTGTGSKAKATVWTADGAKIKGYIAQAGDDDFVIRDRKTDTPTTVRYDNVVKYDQNKGHSTAKWVTVGVLAGVGTFLIILFATIAHLD